MFNLQPTLIGKLVKIRPLKVEDFDALYKVASDKQLWAQHPQPRRCERDYFRENFFEGAVACRGGLVYEKTDGEVIGATRYYNYREKSRDVMIGYTFLARKCWGSTYNRETKHLLLTHAYQWVDIAYFAVGVNNVRSRTAMGKIGGVLLTPEQQIQRNVIVPGSIVFQIKKTDFKGLV